MTSITSVTWEDALVIKNRGRICLVRTEDVDYVQAAGNYAEVHTATKSHLLRNTMHALEADLDPQRFVRIHRSFLVNLSRIKALNSSAGSSVVIMSNGTCLPMGRSYRARLMAVLGIGPFVGRPQPSQPSYSV